MSQKKKVEVENNVAEQPKTQDAPVSLSIADLQVMAQVIDLACQRGAFRAPELAQVGGVYDKLAAFLKQVSEAQTNQQSAQNDSVAS